MRSLFNTIWCYVILIPLTSSISFTLDGSEKFCMGENAVFEDILVGSWKYSQSNDGDDPDIIVTITDPDKTNKFESKDVSGSFSIDVKEDGLYNICFYNTGRTIRSVTLESKNMLKNENKNNMMKKEHLEPLQQQLQGIINSAKHLSSDLEHLKVRE
eukprot:20293_1